MTEIISPELTTEEARSALREPPYNLRLADGKNSDWYYNPDDDHFFARVTTVIRKTTPMAYGLLKWYIREGENAYKILGETSAYGDWLHIQLQHLVLNRTYDLDEMEDALREHSVAMGYDYLYEEWLRKARYGILSLEAFIREREVEPLASEIRLCSKDGYAGALDLPCMMNFDKKRVRAIVDLKSGESGFWPDNEIQLHMYKRAWEENYPDEPIDNVFNLAPVNWKKKPTYKLVNQTDSDEAAKIPYLLKLFALGSSGPPARLTTVGIIKPDKPLEKNYAFQTIRDRI